jgi:hypothetical protein
MLAGEPAKTGSRAIPLNPAERFPPVFPEGSLPSVQFMSPGWTGQAKNGDQKNLRFSKGTFLAR